VDPGLKSWVWLRVSACACGDQAVNNLKLPVKCVALCDP